MAGARVPAALLSAVIAITSSATVEPPTAERTPVDIKVAALQLVSDVRALASDAKKGMAVRSISREALQIRTEASDLIQSIAAEAAVCETNLVIKLAAAGIGSHEVLILLLADDGLSVLNGRLSLSLAFLEHVAQQMEDELAISTDVRPYLEAIIFGTNATSSIAETADEVVKEVISVTNNKKGDDKQKNVARRQSFNLGGGVRVSPSQGLEWSSSSGRTSAKVRPTFDDGLGIAGGVQHTSQNGRTNFNAQAALNFNHGLTSASAGVKHTFPGDRTSLSVTPSWSREQGFGIGASVEHKFANGRGSVFFKPSYNEKNGPQFGVGVNFKR